MKTLKKISAIIALMLLCTTFSKAQMPYYIDEETGEEHDITRQTKKEILNKYLEQNDFKDIEFNPDTTSVYSFRVQEKSGNWMLYNASSIAFVLAPQKYSLDFPNSIFGYEAPVTTAKRKKKNYIYSLNSEQLLEQFWFDEIKYFVFNDTTYVTYDLQEDEIHVSQKYIAALKRKNKWAACYLDLEEVHQVTPFYVNSIEDIPFQKIFYHFKENNHPELTGIPNPLLELSEIININEYQSINFNTKTEGGTPIRLQDKKGDWWLFDAYNSDIMGKEGYSIYLTDGKCGDFAIAERKNKKHIFPLGPDGGNLNEEIWFEDYEYHYREEYIDARDEEGYYIYDSTGNVIYDTVKTCDYLILKRDDQWACAYYSDEMKRVYQLSGFHFNTPDECMDSLLNYTGGYTSEPDYESMEIINDYLLKNTDIDIAFQIGWYEHKEGQSQPMLQVRNAQTKRWSIQVLGSFEDYSIYLRDGHFSDFDKPELLLCGDFAIAERKNKKHIFPLGSEGAYMNEDIWFEEYEYHFRYEYTEVLNEYGEYTYDANGNLLLYKDKICAYILLKRDDKWACALYSDKTKRVYQLTGFYFNNPEEFPDTLFNYFNKYDEENDYEPMKIISDYLLENTDIDIAFQIGWYEFSEDQSYPMLQVRHAQTNRWSIQILGSFKKETQFPVAASSITRHYNDFYKDLSIFEVWCDDKVGYYYYKHDEDIQQVLPCEYDDFKYVYFKEEVLDVNGGFAGYGKEAYGCAIKKEGKWSLYYLDTPKKQVKGSAETIDGLKELWLNR